MTIPTAPTPTTLVTEALTRFLNGGTPDSGEITRALDYGLEKVKRDIMGIGKTWRPLLRLVYDITKVGVSHYDNPADFEQDLSVGLMSGSHTGLLGTVTSVSLVTLASVEDAIQGEVEGKYLLLTSGTGVDQAEIVDDYNLTTKVCLMASAYAVLPVVPVGYMIVNQITDLTKTSMGRYDQFEYPGRPGIPERFIPITNQTVGQLALHPVPAAIYGIRRRYYADILKLDTTGTLYNTLLRKWANVFEQGVFVWKLQEDDDRYEAQNAIYQQMLMNLLTTDLDGYTPPAPAKQGA
jgi:hypothetical protein